MVIILQRLYTFVCMFSYNDYLQQQVAPKIVQVGVEQAVYKEKFLPYNHSNLQCVYFTASLSEMLVAHNHLCITKHSYDLAVNGKFCYKLYVGQEHHFLD